MDNADGSHFEVRGTLNAVDGAGSVRIEIPIAAPSRIVWAAVTEPEQLARWLGEVMGDLRAGGRYQAHVFPSGWEGAGQILECEPGRRWRVNGAEPGHELSVTEIVITPAGDAESTIVFTSTGLPLDRVAAYGVGNQLQLENLAAYLRGGSLVDPDYFWNELLPKYQELQVN